MEVCVVHRPHASHVTAVDDCYISYRVICTLKRGSVYSSVHLTRALQQQLSTQRFPVFGSNVPGEQHGSRKHHSR